MATFVYGPVPSRRLGRSLGVDIVPFKICTYDCIYCQLGRTTQKTLDRASFVPVDEILEELGDTLGRVPRPDYVTISGSGEPTLHVDLGRLAEEIKKATDVPLAIITNGSLLFRPEVRRACRGADLVVPSLDAGDDPAFQYVNRPHPSLSFRQVVEGLVQFREEYKGQIWLEVLLLGGVTATASEVLKIKECTDRIQPDRIQLNTVVRPAAEDFAFPVQPAELNRVLKLFGERAEIIASFPTRSRMEQFEARRDEILSLLSRRPCSIEDIANGLMLNKNQLIKCLDDLLSKGLIDYMYRNGRVYYVKGVDQS
jgi:wyosine [tRNA(Phe)-imidazoG37] synthetase (radical SAM superfamily)